MSKNMDKCQINNLVAIAEAVRKLPFGESQALPWCRKSFPELDTVMKEYEMTLDKLEIFIEKSEG